MLTTIISHGGELTRIRLWQESALAALPAIIAATSDALNLNNTDGYAKVVARVAYAIADEVYLQNGPSESRLLRELDPFKAGE